MTIKKHPAIKLLSSLQLTVVCLIILIILIVWGTVYQAGNGLYQAQQKFFHSWYFLILGFIPFPGTNLVMFILFINLVASLIFRIGIRLQKSGNLLIHLGILILLLGGFISSMTTVESVVTVMEGQEQTLSSAYHEWEVAVWPEENHNQATFAFTINRLKPGKMVTLLELGITLRITTIYRNCQAFVNENSEPDANLINSSGIVALKPRPGEKKPGRNTPGLMFRIQNPPGINKQILLYANDPQPTRVILNEKPLVFSLRKRRYQLPFTLKLLDFKKVTHPGSDIAKSFESLVEIKGKHLNRTVRISMNKPLRYKNFALFQSSYFKDRRGNEHTVLAVVNNAFRLFPYFASGIIFLGMLVHFITALWRGSRRKKVDQQDR